MSAEEMSRVESVLEDVRVYANEAALPNSFGVELGSSDTMGVYRGIGDNEKRKITLNPQVLKFSVGGKDVFREYTASILMFFQPFAFGAENGADTDSIEASNLFNGLSKKFEYDGMTELSKTKNYNFGLISSVAMKYPSKYQKGYDLGTKLKEKAVGHELERQFLGALFKAGILYGNFDDFVETRAPKMSADEIFSAALLKIVRRPQLYDVEEIKSEFKNVYALRGSEAQGREIKPVMAKIVNRLNNSSANKEVVDEVAKCYNELRIDDLDTLSQADYLLIRKIEGIISEKYFSVVERKKPATVSR